MADGAYQLAGCVHLADALQGIRVAPDLVGCPAARGDQASERGGREIADRAVHLAWVAVLAAIFRLAEAGHLDLVTGLLEPQLRVPDLEILVLGSDQHQNGSECHGARSCLVLSPGPPTGGPHAG